MAEKLYCPRCAASFAADTSYCRSCGLELAGVTSIVNGDASNGQMISKRPNFKFMTVGVALFILSLVVGLLFGALREFNLFDPRVGKAIFYVFVAVAMLTIGLGFVFPSRKFSKRRVSNREESTDRGTAPLAHSLPDTPARFEDVNSFATAGAQPVSVTERTTRDLSAQ